MRISVILPNYNSEKFLSKAIDSFLMQNYNNKELVIVDAKSTDGSHLIIKNYAEKFSSIKWIKEADSNVTDAINIGLKYVTGDFIAFLAADVFYYADDIFSTVVENYNMIPFDGILFDYYIYYPGKRCVILNKCPNVAFTKDNLLRFGTIVGFDNIFISREVYKKYRYNHNFNLCSDWEFFLRITQEFSLFIYKEKIATINVQDGNNLSMKYYQEQLKQIKEVGLLYNSNNVDLYFSPLSSRTKLKRKIKSLVKSILGY